MKKAQLVSPLTTAGAFLGIIALVVLFMAAVSFVNTPDRDNAANDITNYGNFFMNNYLVYEFNVDSQRLTMAEVMLLYKDAEGAEKTKYKDLIYGETNKIISALFPSDKGACFSIYFDGNAEIKKTGQCDKNKLEAEAMIPRKNDKMMIKVKGES